MIRKRIYTGIAVLAAWLLPLGSTAQQGMMYDGINSNLTRPGYFIYYGKYKHADDFERESDGTKPLLVASSCVVEEYESDATPVLWRIMGKEGTDNATTLMSHYVIDTMTYGKNSQVWATSDLYTWLQTAFSSSFTIDELNIIPPQPNVYAPRYTVANGSNPPSNNTFNISSTADISNSTRFYLPWGTPYAPASFDNNRVFWTLGESTGIAFTQDSLSSSIKTAAPKGNATNPVYYWLRNLRGSPNEYVSLVKPDGNINMEGIGVSMGLRPMFRLDTTQVIFAAELTERSDLERLDQDEADGTLYRDGVMIGDETGTATKVFKLTVCDGLSTPSSLPYDYDETLAAGRTVALKPNDTLRLGFGANAAGYDSIAYKFVRDGSGGREILRRGFTPVTGTNDSLAIVARNIYTETIWTTSNPTAPNPDASALYGDCDAYVWLQNNNALESHTGSTPMRFNLHIMDDDDAPQISLVGKIRRRPSASNPSIADSAIISFRIQENIGGKYYYMIVPSSMPPPTSVADFINSSLAWDNSGKIPFGVGSPLITDTIVGFTDNAGHKIYYLAKDSVRNTSTVYQFDIPSYVPNTKPDSIPYTVYLEPGETVTVPVGSIASDPDVALYGDVLQITSIDVPPLPTLATAAINMPDSATITITASSVVAGDTAVYVTVKDYDRDSTKCRIGIVIRFAPPNGQIDYVEETITGLNSSSGRYSINGVDTIVSNPVVIREDWFGTTLTVVELNASGAPQTDAQLIVVPPRPAPPVVRAYNESYFDFEDGYITLVNDSMQYRVDTAALWTNVRAGRTNIIDLHPGVYLVRYKAIAGKQFASLPAAAEIGNGGAPPIISREIILTETEGVTTTPTFGSHRIESHTTFSFTAVFSGAQLKVKARRTATGEDETLDGIPNANGGFDYLIRRIVTTPVVVTFGPETDSNEIADGATSSVWTFRGAIHIKTQNAETACVYTLSGTLVKQAKLTENGETSIALPQGVYIVTLSDGARAKVIVN